MRTAMGGLAVIGLVVMSLSACAPGGYASTESTKLLGTVINSALDPSMSKAQIAELTKQCAALQARISACKAIGEGAAACIDNVKAQSAVADKCVL